MRVGKQELGLLDSRHPPHLLCSCVAHSWQAYLYAKCCQQTRLNNSCVWEWCWALVLAYLAPKLAWDSVCVLAFFSYYVGKEWSICLLTLEPHCLESFPDAWFIISALIVESTHVHSSLTTETHTYTDSHTVDRLSYSTYSVSLAWYRIHNIQYFITDPPFTILISSPSWCW